MLKFLDHFRSYRLRTLLLVVTLVGLWLGWEVNVVRQRKALLRELKTRFYADVMKAAEYEGRFPAGQAPTQVARVSTLRGWLGDEAVQEIRVVPTVAKESDQARIRRWFPEAKLVSELPLEPCHPGCFPLGTLVVTPQGPRAIESIQLGDWLVAFDRDGRQKSVRVSSIFKTSNRLVEVETPAGTLVTTPTQPLCRSFSSHVAAGRLEQGDQVLVWDDGRARPAPVVRVTKTDRVGLVFNLVLRDSESFIAGGYLARSKPPAEPPNAVVRAGETPRP